MSGWIDISAPVQDGLPVWPGSAGVRLERMSRLEAGDVANVTRYDTDVHVGTHIDAPLHFIPDGAGVDRLPLDVLIGPAIVVAAGDVAAVGSDLLAAAGISRETTRVLLRTRTTPWWTEPFRSDYAALTLEGARWLVDRDVRLVGIDSLSIQRYEDDPETHRVLLRAGIVIVEGLDLAAAPPGGYDLVCLPVRLAGAEAAPARAVLRPLRARRRRP